MGGFFMPTHEIRRYVPDRPCCGPEEDMFMEDMWGRRDNGILTPKMPILRLNGLIGTCALSVVDPNGQRKPSVRVQIKEVWDTCSRAWSVLNNSSIGRRDGVMADAVESLMEGFIYFSIYNYGLTLLLPPEIQIINPGISWDQEHTSGGDRYTWRAWMPPEHTSQWRLIHRRPGEKPVIWDSNRLRDGVKIN